MNTIAGRLLIILSLATAALCVVGVRYTSADFANVKIAVADITKIFDSYEKREYYQAELDRRRETIPARERRFEERMRRLEEQMAALSMGSPQRQDIRRQIAELEEEYRLFKRQTSIEMDALVSEGRQAIYHDILDAVEKYARENNIDLVIKQQSYSREQPTAGDLSLRIAERGVLYCAPRLDITEDIADMLNDEYRAARKRGEFGAERPKEE